MGLLSNQMIHKMVQDMGSITGLECAIWDENKNCLAMTSQKPWKIKEDIHDVSLKDKEKLTKEYGLFYVSDEDEHGYILSLMGGETSQMQIYGRLGVSQLQNLLYLEHEKMDRNQFIQKLISNQIPLLDMYRQAKKMKIAIQQKRVVFVIEGKLDEEPLVIETLRSLYATGIRDFVTAIDEKHIILIKELDETAEDATIAQMANIIVDTINTEAMISIRIAYSTVVYELEELARAYREAETALQVGRVFYSARNILAYDKLGIGRLLHQLPATLCEMFLKEVYNGDENTVFEEEELATAYAFLDNNLNISETSRKLYVHRNTLVYRLEKIQKKTGLDIRIFEDALTFKIAMMVRDHTRYMNTHGGEHFQQNGETYV